MPNLMEGLLLATGFTGALTLRWLVRLLLGQSRPSVKPFFHLEDGGSEILVQQLGGARREVLVQTIALSSRPVAQALVDARLRGVTVEVLLDASNEQDEHAELHFLVEQGLPPWVDTQHDLGMEQVVLIDGQTVILGGGALLILQGHPDAYQAYREQFQKHKSHARAVPAKTSTWTQAQTEPEPVSMSMPMPAPMPEPVAEARTASGVEEVVENVASSLVGSGETEEIPSQEGCSEEEQEEKTAPVVTPAAAELFARLRQELSERKEQVEVGQGQKKVG